MRAVLAALCLAGTLAAVFWAGAEAGARSERALRARASEPLTALESDLEAALSIPAGGARAVAVASKLQEAGPGDLDTVFGLIKSTNLPVDAGTLMIVFDWAAGFDPPAAFARAARLEHRDGFVALPAVIRRWARQDPAEARRAIEEIDHPRGLDALWEALIMGWAERQGDQRVWSFVESMEMGPSRQKLIRTLVARKIVVEGIEPTLRHVESIPDDAPRRFKLQVFRRTASVLAREDPERAVAWATQHFAGPFGDGLLRKVASARVATEGAPGFTWLSEVEAGPQRDEAVVESYKRWLMTDRDIALRWLRNAPSQPAFEPALVLLASATLRNDPSAAVEILTRIEDPGLRQTATLRLGRSWLRKDPAAATDWIRGSGLPDDLQTELLEGREAETRLPSRDSDGA